MRLTPINMAEAIIEPFWDPSLSGLAQWAVTPGAEHGLRLFQNWCWAQFEWARKPAAGPALQLSRACDLDCRDYDDLVLSVMAPEASSVRILVETDKGAVAFTAPPAPVLKKEHAVDLRGATRLRRITLELTAGAEGIAEGWFNWIGLRNRTQLARYLREWQRFDAAWDGYLRPDSFLPKFTPAYGLVVNSAELERLRQQHAAFVEQHGTSPYVEAGRAAAVTPPETLIGEYVNFWGDTRYNRERDHGRLLLVHGANAAVAGLLLRDPRLLRLAARYAMAIAMCRHWDDGMLCCFPDGNFDHRCFVQSLCAFDCGLILDLAGEYFTELGRDLILRRLAEEGLGNINYTSWRYEYIFHCNQLAWFTPGRMLAYLVLERHWQHVTPYTEIARRDLLESLDLAILPDGGYVEGPTYFRCVGRDGGLPLYFHARARGLDFVTSIPERMRRCADFAEALISTDDDQDVIPICDAAATHDLISQAVMSAALPGSAWSRMYRKAVAAAGGLPAPRPGTKPPAPMADAFLAWNLGAAGTDAAPPRAFVFLPEMGVMASTRRLGADSVKLLIQGNKAGAGHTHEDKGSFVLEFAGETFAMDPGTCDYSSPFAGIAKNCERHNMLIPCGLTERPQPEVPLPADVRPVGDGDAVRFRARIDVTPGWTGLYRRWVRSWDSPRPDILIITDEYELARGTGVDFCWITRRDVRVEGRRVLLRGYRGSVELELPPDVTARLEELPFHGGVTHRRLAIHRDGLAGTLQITVRLAGH